MDRHLILRFSGSEMTLTVPEDEAEGFVAYAQEFWGGREKSKYFEVRDSNGNITHVNLGRVCAFQVRKHIRANPHVYG